MQLQLARGYALPSSPRREFSVRTLTGGGDAWGEQLSDWHRDGWELLAIAPEGDERQAILERRV